MSNLVRKRLKRYARLRDDAQNDMTTTRKLFWTFGNVLILCGVYLLLFVGGLFADEQYNVYAARGDTTEMTPMQPVAVVRDTPPPDAPTTGNTPPEVPQAPPTRANPRFNIPLLNNGSQGALTNIVPTADGNFGPSMVTRITVPAIELDVKVVEVGWRIEQVDGQEVAVWDVDKYRVGHHRETSNPGQGGNIVLAGHSGGAAYPFNDIFYLKAGDAVQLTSNGQVYEYLVSDHILVDEVGQPFEKRIENARYIEPTDEEMITMVACWPLTGPDKFKQRIIIRAKPAVPTISADEANKEHSGWTAR